jgi:hypothetical protein
MPKRKTELSREEQSERFKRDAQRLIDAGELNPTVAQEKLDAALQGGVVLNKQPEPGPE